MKKKQVNIPEKQFAKLHLKIRKLEADQGKLKIGKLSLSAFLSANATFSDDSSDSKPVRTKRRILYIAGDYTTDPSTLSGSLKLKSNLGYDSDEYSLLQIRLDKLVKEYLSAGSISTVEANACEKVSDCVTLVNKNSTSPL